jgi:aerobic-type carbon monoxide dehydrogenase small subunit (CoxS/CutS family)
LIKGVIAAGAVSSGAYLFRSSIVRADQAAAGSVERLVTLSVNGQQRRVDVMKQETLATTLRYKLGLTGTKLGCDRSECGACTVLIDDVPHYSCSILTHTARGKQITTIEGLASADGTLHPVQQGVVSEQGFQCAFCMSGFIMARRIGPRHFRQPVPLPGLRQDPHRHDVRRGESEKGELTCLPKRQSIRSSRILPRNQRTN